MRLVFVKRGNMMRSDVARFEAHPERPMTTVGLAAPSLTTHQLEDVPLSSASSSLSCLRMQKLRKDRNRTKGRVPIRFQARLPLWPS